MSLQPREMLLYTLTKVSCTTSTWSGGKGSYRPLVKTYMFSRSVLGGEQVVTDGWDEGTTEGADVGPTAFKASALLSSPRVNNTPAVMPPAMQSNKTTAMAANTFIPQPATRTPINFVALFFLFFFMSSTELSSGTLRATPRVGTG